MDEGRIRLAEELLREAVFHSRGRQSTFQALRPAQCGLGEKAEVVLDLSPRGRELCGRLFADGIDERASERLRATMAEWIERQDALDRKRNHFLKAFRGRHGFDRTAYAPEVLAAFEAGLAEVASEEDAARRRAAQEIAGT